MEAKAPPALQDPEVKADQEVEAKVDTARQDPEVTAQPKLTAKARLATQDPEVIAQPKLTAPPALQDPEVKVLPEAEVVALLVAQEQVVTANLGVETKAAVQAVSAALEITDKVDGVVLAQTLRPTLLHKALSLDPLSVRGY